jgi:hypothetical protein
MIAGGTSKEPIEPRGMERTTQECPLGVIEFLDR